MGKKFFLFCLLLFLPFSLNGQVKNPYQIEDFSQLLEKKINYVTALASDGRHLMIGSENGQLYFLYENKDLEDLTGLLAGKMGSVKSIAFVSEDGYWLVGGEPKKASEPGVLFKLIPGGVKTQDLTSETSALGIEAVTDISCLPSKCLIAGRPRKLVFYDGNNFIDLSNQLDWDIGDSVKLANNKIIWLIGGITKKQNQEATEYSFKIFYFDGQTLKKINFDSQPEASPVQLGLGWNSRSWFLIQGRPKIKGWLIDNFWVPQDISSTFSQSMDLNFYLNPIIYGGQGDWLVGGGSQGKKIFYLKDNQILDLGRTLPGLALRNIFSFVKNPWGEGVFLGGSYFDLPFLGLLKM